MRALGAASLLACARLSGVALALGPWGASVQAQARQTRTPPPEVLQTMPSAQMQGQGRLRFLGLHIYDIRLWVTSSTLAVPLALEIEYARALVGRAIAERSLKEMRRVAGEVPISDPQARDWETRMAALFPDVRPGDRITGTLLEGRARFHLNGQLLGDVEDARFARLFFDIWLSPRTSEPDLRAALLGTP